MATQKLVDYIVALTADATPTSDDLIVTVNAPGTVPANRKVTLANLPVAWGTTATELGYTSGVTSAIQTQMNLKAPLASPTFTGVVKFPDGSAAAPGLGTTTYPLNGFYMKDQYSMGVAHIGTISLELKYVGIDLRRNAMYIRFYNTYLYHDASNVLCLGYPGVVISPQEFRVYTSYTDASNYERFSIGTAAGTITLACQTLGTGTNNIDLALTPAGTGAVNITTGVLKMAGTQVVGARVIDARCDDVCNSGDVTTDGVIDALRDAMIAHGLIAAA